MIVKAAAKINLMLDVVGKLPNGYHSLFMIMQSVSCYDTVRVDRTGENGIKIISSDERVPKDEKNIAYKAAEAFFDYAGISDRGIEIEIGKKIPMAAGLAGGSADGAGVLYILNRLYKTGFDEFTLCSIGEKVGADVPFSLTGGTSLCVDTGGVIAPLPAISDCFIVLCKPDMGVSTVNAYKQIDEAQRIRHADRTAMLYAMKNRDTALMYEKMNNVFEQVIEVPKRPYIKQTMKRYGAKAALMSGSGPTVFGIFTSEDEARLCFNKLKMQFSETYLTRPVKMGIEEA